MNIFAVKEVADEYDAYYQSEQGEKVDKLEKDAILKHISRITPGNLLEIGCGTGHWTAFFSEQGFQITATDVADEMMKFAKEKGIPNVKFQTADVLNLSFDDNSFDQLAVITALEFCGDIKKAFSEIHRVLKPGGWFIAGCLNANSTLGKVKDNDPVYKHGNFMTKAELTKHLKTIGNPNIIECVHLSADFQILDGTNDVNKAEGVFMAAAVQKIK